MPISLNFNHLLSKNTSIDIHLMLLWSPLAIKITWSEVTRGQNLTSTLGGQQYMFVMSRREKHYLCCSNCCSNVLHSNVSHETPFGYLRSLTWPQRWAVDRRFKEVDNIVSDSSRAGSWFLLRSSSATRNRMRALSPPTSLLPIRR